MTISTMNSAPEPVRAESASSGPYRSTRAMLGTRMAPIMLPWQAHAIVGRSSRR